MRPLGIVADKLDGTPINFETINRPSVNEWSRQIYSEALLRFFKSLHSYGHEFRPQSWGDSLVRSAPMEGSLEKCQTDLIRGEHVPSARRYVGRLIGSSRGSLASEGTRTIKQ